MAKGYSQEDIDYEEIFTSISRLDAIRMLLAFVSYMDFKHFQMDVKSVFVNGFIQEEVYVEQPLDFENHEFSNHIFKLTEMD